MKPVVYTRIPRIDRALIDRASRINVADMHEGLGAILGRQCLLRGDMKPLFRSARICGQAITSFNYPGDNLLLHAAVRAAEPGDVLVLTNGGSPHGALWGEMITYYCQRKGVSGAVIDGGVRDTLQIRDAAFPVFATHISVSHPEKRGPGAVNVPVDVAGVRINPGDVILGDADGVLAIPPDALLPAIERAEVRMAMEQSLKARLDEGATMYDLLGLQANYDAAGIVEIDGTWRD